MSDEVKPRQNGLTIMYELIRAHADFLRQYPDGATSRSDSSSPLNDSGESPAMAYTRLLNEMHAWVLNAEDKIWRYEDLL